MTSERERAEFEKWQIYDLSRSKVNPDEYFHEHIQDAWECWQAARREERARCAELVGHELMVDYDAKLNIYRCRPTCGACRIEALDKETA